MKKQLIILMTVGILFLLAESVFAMTAKSENIVGLFMLKLMTEGEKEARAYVISDVEIPEIRESTPIGGFASLTTAKEDV